MYGLNEDGRVMIRNMPTYMVVVAVFVSNEEGRISVKEFTSRRVVVEVVPDASLTIDARPHTALVVSSVVDHFRWFW